MTIENGSVLTKYFVEEMTPDGLSATGQHLLVVSAWRDENGLKHLETIGTYTKNSAVRLGRFLESDGRIPGSEILTTPPQKNSDSK